jgi:RNA 2',3'-cyclic 3'-phosphodiesterase
MRLFVALKPPSAALDALQEVIDILTRINKRLPVSWTYTEDLHATLFFIGEIAEERIEEIKLILESIVNKSSSFYLELSQFMYLPNKSRHKIIAARVHDQSGFLNQLHEETSSKLKNMVLYKTAHNKIYKPHITLGRNRSSQKIKTLHNILSSDAFHVSEIHLIKSNLQSFGPHYTALATYTLHNAR